MPTFTYAVTHDPVMTVVYCDGVEVEIVGPWADDNVAGAEDYGRVRVGALTTEYGGLREEVEELRQRVRELEALVPPAEQPSTE